VLLTTEPIDDFHEICCEPSDTGHHPNVLVTNNMADTGTCDMGATAAPFHTGSMKDLWNCIFDKHTSSITASFQ
jgi:hypothetical protein